MEPEHKAVYAAINAVQRSLAQSGIAKKRQNAQQGYSFRGIDDVYNAVSALLASNGLCIMPRCTERNVVERQTKSGGALFYVTVRCEFDFVASSDGSVHTVVTYGEAMDAGDKATNKAMSAAYKYALMQTFAIPTEGDHDTENNTQPEVYTKEQQIALNVLRDAALVGTEALKAAWKGTAKGVRESLADELPGLKVAAVKADAVPGEVPA